MSDLERGIQMEYSLGEFQTETEARRFASDFVQSARSLLESDRKETYELYGFKLVEDDGELIHCPYEVDLNDPESVEFLRGVASLIDNILKDPDKNAYVAVDLLKALVSPADDEAVEGEEEEE